MVSPNQVEDEVISENDPEQEREDVLDQEQEQEQKAAQDLENEQEEEDDEDEDEDEEEHVHKTIEAVNDLNDGDEDDEIGGYNDADEDEDSDDSENSEGKDDNKITKSKGVTEDNDNEDIADNASNEDEDEDEDEDDDDERRKVPSNAVVYDFDIMMAKKKEENSRKRRRRGYDIINDNDDIIADIINQMRDAVEADIEANKNRMAATNKLKLLPFVTNQLRKIDLRDAFLDSDVLRVLTEWLTPLPDKSLPHLNIREELLKILIGFNLYDVDRIKSSGIGKAIMYLYKHPKETKENKQRAKQLISSWSRPIFNLDSNFSAISREEREERDKELQRRARRQPDSSDNEDPSDSRSSKKPKQDTAAAASKPGDKGWIPRARVPAPSLKDYVIRPRSKVDGDVGKGSKRPSNMLEKLMKTHQERRRASKQQRAVNMKIDKL